RARRGARHVELQDVPPGVPRASIVFAEWGTTCFHSAGAPRRTKGSVDWADVEPDENALGVREVSDDLPRRRRKPAHERRDGQNLVTLRQARVLHQVDDLDAVATGHVLLADPLEVGERGHALRGLAGHVEPQLPEGLLRR